MSKKSGGGEAERSFNKVAVLKGGPSSERDVSLRSGAAVAKGLREAGYEVVEIDVVGRELNIPAGVEAVFIALHGEFGEDGGVQELLEKIGMPYTGSSPAASRTSFDKILSKKAMLAGGIPTPDYRVMTAPGPCAMPLPVVVKPARQGSSIGVHRVFQASEWDEAVRSALSYDSEIVVEAYIEGRELTVGVVDDVALPVVEIVAPSDWYSYEAKYTKGRTEYLVPAPLDEAASALCRRTGLDTFRALGCRGFGRVDIRFSPDGRPYVLELNNIPGFTETSLLPKAAAHYGLNFSQLCDRIMRTIPM